MASSVHQASIQARQFVLTNHVQPSAPGPDDEAPPPYNTLPAEPSSGCGTAMYSDVHGGGAAGYACGAQCDTKLGYMDFVPRLLRRRFMKDNQYELFSTLIERANTWLEDHSWVKVNTCETVIWSGLKTSSIYSEQSCSDRSLTASKRTRQLLGLRLWFEQDTFPQHSRTKQAHAIQCRTFVPRHDQETFQQMIDRINRVLEHDPFAGDIFSVEVVILPCRNGTEYRPCLMDTHLCYWKEDPEYNKVYALCVRIYARVTQHVTTLSQNIGYKDFVPEHNGQSKENKGYETLSDVIDSASRWIASQEGVLFISIRCINVKVKKKISFHERCVFTEHVCARNRENVFTGVNSNTNYLRIVRAFYVILTSHSSDSQSSLRLTSRAFTPSHVRVVTSSLSSGMDHPGAYEEQKKVLERINQWLAITGARLFHIETICMRQTASPLLQSLGPDASYSQNSLTNTHSNIEHWVYYIRVYLDGVYREPPPAIALVSPSALVPTQFVF